MYKRDDGNWECQECGYFSKFTTRVLEHIEAKHFLPTSGYICDICQKTCSTRNALKCHVYRYHGKKSFAFEQPY